MSKVRNFAGQAPKSKNPQSKMKRNPLAGKVQKKNGIGKPAMQQKGIAQKKGISQKKGPIVKGAAVKGIKMFRGVAKGKKEEDEENEENVTIDSSMEAKNGNDSTSNIEDDSDSEVSDQTLDSSALGPRDLLGESLADDDEDDSDFEAGSEDEDDSEEKIKAESEDDSEGKTEDASMEMVDLLGDTIVEDDDDEDFKMEDVEDNDADESISDAPEDGEATTPETRAKTKDEEEDQASRTIFVGNVSLDCSKGKLKKVFQEFGPIESYRFRGALPENPKMPMKLAYIQKKFNPKTTSIIAFVVFKDQASANKALVMNGRELEGKILRVSLLHNKNPLNIKKSIFIGNLPFDLDDEKVWEHFKKCGDIEFVKIIKHKPSGKGKGYGYVNFKSEDAVAIALEMDGQEMAGREIRVKPNTFNSSFPRKPHPERVSKKRNKSLKAQNNLKSKKKPESNEFQGEKADSKDKKKRRPNKSNKRKGEMAGKLMATKKPKSD